MLHTKGAKVKNIPDGMEIVTRAESEGDKHAIWGILYLLPWLIYDFFV